MTAAAYNMIVFICALALTFIAAWFFERRESKQTIRELKVTNESLREYMNKKVSELRARECELSDSRDVWIEHCRELEAQGKVNASEVSQVLDGARQDLNDARQKIVNLTNALLTHDDHMASMKEAHRGRTEALSLHIAALKGQLCLVKVRSGELSATINRTFQRIASELEPEGLEVLASCAEDLKNPDTGRWISSEIRDAARAAEVSGPTVTKTKEEFYL